MDNFNTLAAEAIRKALGNGNWIDVPELRVKVVEHGIEQLMADASPDKEAGNCETVPLKIGAPVWPGLTRPVGPAEQPAMKFKPEVVDTPKPAVELLAWPVPETTAPADQVDAAWQQRELQQAEEFDEIESTRRKAEKGVMRITGDRHDRINGFDWQLIALPRDRNPDGSHFRVFTREPTPEEFWDLFKFYDAMTHYVHLNKWSNGYRRYEPITPDYMERHAVALRNIRGTITRAIKVTKGDGPRPLNFAAIIDTGWKKPEFEWCISRKDGFAQYQDREPTRVDLMKHSTTSLLATKRKRPEIYL